MARGMVHWILAGLAVMSLVAACGGGAAVGSDSGLAGSTPTQVRQAAIDAVRNAGSVHVSGSGSDDAGRPARFDFRIQGNSSTGTFDISGARVALTFVDDALYLRTDRAGWGILGSPDAASLFADRWVKVPADSAEPEDPFTIETMLDELAQKGVELAPGVKRTTLNGTKVVVITYTTGDKLYVTDTREARPLRFTSAAVGAIQFSVIDFSEYGVDFHITAPPDAFDSTQF